MWGMFQPPTKAEEPKNSVVPFACLRKTAGKTWCGREPDEQREFVFTDAGYAVEHYRSHDRVGVCDACAERYALAGDGKTKADAPMATRGLKENDK